LIHDIQITYFRQDLEIEIKLEVQERIINLDTAIICGLIVNELVTNAIKHAFTGRANGTLEISFKQEEQTGKFLLKIADNGVSLPVNITPGISNSFGMQLLDVFVKQLGGTFEIIREKGTIFLIRF
jgi:two-component sensor histidine kinase